MTSKTNNKPVISLVKNGIAWLAKDGFIKAKQFHIVPSPKDPKLLELTFASPRDAFEISIILNASKIAKEQYRFKQDAHMAYVLYRIILSGIGKSFATESNLLKSEVISEYSDPRTYFKDGWYFINFINKALQTHNFTPLDLMLMPLSKKKADKEAVEFKKLKDTKALHLTNKQINELKHIINLSSYGLEMFNTLTSVGVMQTKVLFTDILDWFSDTNYSNKVFLHTNELKMVPLSVVEKVIVNQWFNKSAFPYIEKIR